MSRIRSARNIDSALCKKGFRRNVSHDHVYYFLIDSTGNDVGIVTKISHGMGGSTIGVPLISAMSRQLHLSKQQFLDFIDCTLTEEQYRTILREQGLAV